jgi:hypothetical protein
MEVEETDIDEYYETEKSKLINEGKSNFNVDGK